MATKKPILVVIGNYIVDNIDVPPPVMLKNTYLPNRAVVMAQGSKFRRTTPKFCAEFESALVLVLAPRNRGVRGWGH